MRIREILQEANVQDIYFIHQLASKLNDALIDAREENESRVGEFEIDLSRIRMDMDLDDVQRTLLNQLEIIVTPDPIGREGIAVFLEPNKSEDIHRPVILIAREHMDASDYFENLLSHELRHAMDYFRRISKRPGSKIPFSYSKKPLVPGEEYASTKTEIAANIQQVLQSTIHDIKGDLDRGIDVSMDTARDYAKFHLEDTWMRHIMPDDESEWPTFLPYQMLMKKVAAVWQDLKAKHKNKNQTVAATPPSSLAVNKQDQR